jgi:Domain of unknown function (DUF222)/HNH endonuclease
MRRSPAISLSTIRREEVASVPEPDSNYLAGDGLPGSTGLPAEPSLPGSAGLSAETPAPQSVQHAVAMALASLRWLADADLTSAPAAVQACGLRELEAALAAYTTAHANVLAAFCASGGYEDDGHGSPRTWLTWQTRITRPAASAAIGWMRRLAAHRAVAEALRDGAVSVSWARQVCDWTEQLPAEHRAAADGILLAAAAAGLDLADLARLAEELRHRLAGPDRDPDGFADRGLRLDVTLGGAGKLWGDLTPQCAAALRLVLDSLGKKAGPEDTRTFPERDHDALEEACRRLAASACLPDRAGQPLHIRLNMTLDDLTGGIPGDRDPLSLIGLHRQDSELSSGHAGPAPWPAAGPGYDCDASIAPMVTGRIDQDLLDRLAAVLGRRDLADQRQDLLGTAIGLLSGPSGLASLLRTGTLTGPAASKSLPLDLGTPTEIIPPHLRRAVITRDQHCAYPGCDVPPAGCQAHHIKPRSQGGLTKLSNLMLLCSFHHLILVHRWGWSIVLNNDGTTTATSPDGRVFRSHGPPGATAA